MFKQKLIVEKGIMKYITGDSATVEIVKPNLKECKSCGTCIGIENKPNFLEVKTIPGLNIGQQVTLQTIVHSPYESIILLLILPIISLLIGSLIGQKIHFVYPNSQDIRMLSCGLIFFVLSIVAVSIYDKKTRSKKHPRQKIISIDIFDNLNLI